MTDDDRPCIRFHCEPEEGDYVEEDEDGIVTLYDKAGRPRMIMSREAYDEMMKERQQ